MTPVLHAIGCDFNHPRGFVVDRPHGLADEWLLLQFTRPAVVHRGSTATVVPAGRLMLWAPGQTHSYEGHGQGLGNHWCHAGALDEIVRELHVPVEKPADPPDIERTAQAFRELEQEHRRREPGWESVAAGILVAILRSMITSGPRGRLSDLRGEVLAALERPWSIDLMATRLGCSIPTLHRRWRAAFGLSPVDDLIRARLDRARWLIAVAGQPVGEAARAVGYSDARYFARLCRRHRGSSPSSWRLMAQRA